MDISRLQWTRDAVLGLVTEFKMQLDFHDRFANVIKKMDAAGIDYAEKRGISYQMQELKGAILATIMIEHDTLPVSKAEVLAKASETFKNHILETSKAVKDELLAKNEYEKQKAAFEALRSLSSLEKRMMDKSEY